MIHWFIDVNNYNNNQVNNNIYNNNYYYYYHYYYNGNNGNKTNHNNENDFSDDEDNDEVENNIYYSWHVINNIVFCRTYKKMFCNIDFNIKVKLLGVSIAPNDSCATSSSCSWGLFVTWEIATKKIKLLIMKKSTVT